MKKSILIVCGLMGLGASAFLASRPASPEKEQSATVQAVSEAPKRRSREIAPSEVTATIARVIATTPKEENLPPEEIAARKAISQGIEAQPIEVQRQVYEVELDQAAEQIRPTVNMVNRLRQEGADRAAIESLERIISEHNERVGRYKAAYAKLAE